MSSLTRMRAEKPSLASTRVVARTSCSRKVFWTAVCFFTFRKQRMTEPAARRVLPRHRLPIRRHPLRRHSQQRRRRPQTTAATRPSAGARPRTSSAATSVQDLLYIFGNQNSAQAALNKCVARRAQLVAIHVTEIRCRGCVGSRPARCCKHRAQSRGVLTIVHAAVMGT